MAIRRISIELFEESRDGESEIHLLSNVPAKQSPASELADLYRKRWTIEAGFLEITTTLTCEIKTLADPKAALFAFCLALLAYNAVSVIKAASCREHGRERINHGVSGYYLCLEIRQTYDGMMVAIPAPHWKVYGAMSAQEFAPCGCERAQSERHTFASACRLDSSAVLRCQNQLVPLRREHTPSGETAAFGCHANAARTA